MRPLSGREWRQEREEAQEGYVKELWSGRVARLRPPDLATLLAAGQIPDPLTDQVYRMVFRGEIAEPLVDMAKADEQGAPPAEDIQATLALYEVICKAMFVEPRIVDDPQADDEIHIDDVPLVDRIGVWGLAISTTALGVGRLKSFRLQPAPDVEAVPDEPVEQLPAEPVDEPGE